MNEQGKAHPNNPPRSLYPLQRGQDGPNLRDNTRGGGVRKVPDRGKLG